MIGPGSVHELVHTSPVGRPVCSVSRSPQLPLAGVDWKRTLMSQ